MQLKETPIAGLFVFEPKVFGDERGYFYESYNANFYALAGIETVFIQDNQSRSVYGVLRGLHYQLPPYAQTKLVRVVQGEVLDVVVDIREGSPTYGQHFTIVLSAENKRQLYIPHGFAHGFVVLSETAEFLYKVDNYYSKESEGSISFDDPTLNIDWGIDMKMVSVSEKDNVAPHFGEHRKYYL